MSRGVYGLAKNKKKSFVLVRFVHINMTMAFSTRLDVKRSVNGRPESIKRYSIDTSFGVCYKYMYAQC